MKTNYTPQYFIDKFTKIPEKRWCTGVLSRIHMWQFKAQHCALGHCGLRTGHGETRINRNNEAFALITLFNKYGLSVININDNKMGHLFREPTEKKRILAALEYIKKEEEKSLIPPVPIMEYTKSVDEKNWLVLKS